MGGGSTSKVGMDKIDLVQTGASWRHVCKLPHPVAWPSCHAIITGQDQSCANSSKLKASCHVQLPAGEVARSRCLVKLQGKFPASCLASVQHLLEQGTMSSVYAVFIR